MERKAAQTAYQKPHSAAQHFEKQLPSTTSSYRKILKINRKSIFALMTLSEVTSCLSFHECWLQLSFLLRLLGDTFLFSINTVSPVFEPGKICFLLPYLLPKHWIRNLSFRETISFADGSSTPKPVFSTLTKGQDKSLFCVITGY